MFNFGLRLSPHPLKTHYHTPAPLNLLIDFFLLLRPNLPQEQKVTKIGARKPKSSKISQEYNHPWRENPILFFNSLVKALASHSFALDEHTYS